MAFNSGDRIRETTTTTGTGTITLAGAVVGFRSFSSAVAIGDDVHYAIVGPTTEWEVGRGTLLSATTLDRTVVYSSSNAGAAVSFSAGVKQVFCDVPAMLFQLLGRSGDGSVAIPPTLDMPLFTPDAIASSWFTRASTAYQRRPSGLYESVAANVLRIDHDAAGNLQGALIEEVRINGIRNNAMQGGGAGVMPTNWSGGGSGGGVTQTIVGTGVENGIDYIDIRYAGTSTGTLQSQIAFEANSLIAAAQNQNWTASVFLSIVAGSNTNTGPVTLEFAERNSVGTYLGGQDIAIGTVTTGALGASRKIVSRLPSGATTAFINITLNLRFYTAGAVDVTYRIGWPQLEQGQGASSPIRTTGAAATRAADSLIVPVTSEWFSGTEGTFILDFVVPPADTAVTRVLATADDGTTSNGIIVSRSSGGSGLLVQLQIANATHKQVATAAVAPGASAKLAISYGLGLPLMASLNGALPVASTAQTIATPSLTRFRLGQYSNGGNAWNAGIRRPSYLPRALSGAALQSMAV